MSDSGKVTVNYFCLGAVFIFIGSVLLCALGFTVVLPFEVTRAWPPVTCTVVNSTYEPNVCSCDEQLNVFDTCVSKYPCLQIHVFYVPPRRREAFPFPRPNRTVGESAAPKRGKADRRRRSPKWIGEDVDATGSMNASGVHVGYLSTVERNTSLAGSLVDQQRGKYVDSTASIPSRHVEALPRQSGELDNAGFVQSRSLLSSTSLPVGNKHPSKGGVVEVDGWTLSPGGAAMSAVENGTQSLLRMLKYEMENDGMDIGRDDANRGTKVFATLYRSWDDSFNRRCTLTECGDETWNVKEARRFKDDWGRLGQSFLCFYNPLRPDMVIIERTSTVAAVHAVLWPGLCLVGGITLWIGLCLGCWSLGSESTCKDDYGPIY